LFALTHQFLQQLIEGDELYTRVKKNVAPDESQGWTIVLMDRATRFLWDMQCGRKDRKMFKKAMRLLCQVIEQTGDLTLLTDGERRYGSLLFELCSEALRTGKRGRPKKTLRQGVKVRLKNNPTTTSALDMLIFLAYVASKHSDHPPQEAKDVTGKSHARRGVRPPTV